MAELAEVSLSYSGDLADDRELDFYDVAEALKGFQRSLALTTHLVLNGEVITQAPSLEGAQILALVPEQGSWKVTAIIIASITGAYHLGTAPKDTPLGNLIGSAYDYVISETLGFHVDYDKTLGQQYDELKKANKDIKPLPQSKFDATVEKCEVAIRAMHRPIVMSETAEEAKITARIDGTLRSIGPPLTPETHDYIAFTEHERDPREILGRIASYNINTYKGRVFVTQEGRPIPFELEESARSLSNIALITESLRLNAVNSSDPTAEIKLVALRNTSRSGRLKKLIVLRVSR
jgi:hypothetical protein